MDALLSAPLLASRTTRPAADVDRLGGVSEDIMLVRSRLKENPMPSLRVGRRRQITLPSALRRELHLEEGDRVLVEMRPGELVLRPAGRSILALRGSVPVDGPQDFETIGAEVIGGRVKRLVCLATAPGSPTC
jgi:AbrB family looped-hinge helix DNA binding protein